MNKRNRFGCVCIFLAGASAASGFLGAAGLLACLGGAVSLSVLMEWYDRMFP